MRASSKGFASFSSSAITLLVVALGIFILPGRSAAQQLKAQSAIIVAFLTDTLGRPLAGAEVQIVGTSVRGNTDNAGRVALLGVPTGQAILSMRRLGFAELRVPISVTSATPESHFKLTPVAADLEKVVVRATTLKPERYAKTGKFDSFYRRRAQGAGTFITREMLDARNAQKSEDLLRMATGVKIRYRGTSPIVQFMRCGTVNVYIDGIRSHDPFRDFFALSPLDIEAIEIYHGMAQVPPEFSPKPNDCAAIVVWSRWHGGD